MRAFYQTVSKTLLVSLIATVFLAGCGKTTTTPTASVQPSESATAKPSEKPSEKPKDVVTIEFWNTYGEDKDKGTGERPYFVKEIIPAFEKANPGIKIREVNMPTENLEQQVITAAAGGAVPDLMRMDNTWVGNFAKKKALKSLDKNPGFAEIKLAVFEGPMSSNLYKGKYYGIPLNTNTKAAIYNKEILTASGATEPPKTIDELVKAARALKAKGQFGIVIGGPNAWDFLPWFWTLGGKLTDDQYTKATGFLNSAESIKALDTVVSWMDEGLVAPPIKGGKPSTWDGLRDADGGVKAKYLMINDGPWFFSIFGDSVKTTMIPAKMPAGPDGKSHSVVGGENIVMFEGAKHPEEAWKFIQFMLSEEIQVKMASVGLIPTNKKAAASDKLKDVYYLPTYVKELETAYARTPSAQWSKISDRLGLAFEIIINKKATAKDELDKAAKEIDGLLAD